jgi:hypothetical protein
VLTANVGGLPAHMKMKLVEPLRELFKDECSAASVKPARSKGGITLHQGHSLRQKRGGMLPAVDPGVNSIRPLLHHIPALHFILGLVIDAARRTPVLVRQALFDPVAIEAQLI